MDRLSIPAWLNSCSCALIRGRNLVYCNYERQRQTGCSNSKAPPTPRKKANLKNSVGSLGRTILPSGIGDARDEPFTVGADQIEQVGAAVVHLAIDQELEWGP